MSFLAYASNETCEASCGCLTKACLTCEQCKLSLCQPHAERHHCGVYFQDESPQCEVSTSVQPPLPEPPEEDDFCRAPFH